MKNLIITKNENVFKTLNTPVFNKDTSSIYMELMFPQNLQFNKTYYTYYKNEITAFRIVAYAVTDEYNYMSSKLTPNLTYLVQFPNQKLIWLVDFLTENTIVCESKEQMIEYPLTNRKVNLDWYHANNMFPNLAYAAVISVRGQVWKKMDFTPCNNFHPYIKSFVVMGNDVLVLLDDKNNEYFLSKEECVKSILDGCVINDFADEPFEIKVNVLPTQKTTYTLRITEE